MQEGEVMVDLVNSVSYKVEIIFDNGEKLELMSEHDVDGTYVECININETLNISNNNPVGVVSANTLKLSINSKDCLLIPSNKGSKYYGFMNTTAYIKVYLIESGEVIPFGIYYVINWENDATVEKPYHVIIEGTDLLGIINKNAVPDTELKKDINTPDVLDNILTKINENLGEKYKIKYNKANWTFGPFGKLEYNNIEADSMGNWFNILSQSTLTNIYLTRSNQLETDYCLDDKKSDAVCNLHGDKNVVSVSVDKGGFVGYSGVKVNYIINSINAESQLIQLTEQVLTPGDNAYTDIELDKIYKITQVRVRTDQTEPVRVKSFKYNKRTLSMELTNTSSKNATCTIIVYGETLKEDVLSVTRNESNASNEILEVTNRLLPMRYIDTFAVNLLKLIKIKDSSLSVSGYFNPRIKLGDQVSVSVNRLNTQGYYKIIGLSWSIQGSIKCTARLLKTIA